MDGDKILPLGQDEIVEGKKLSTPLDKQPFDAKTQDKFNTALEDPNAKAQKATDAIESKPNPLDVAKNIYTQQPEGTNTIDNIEYGVNKVNERIEAVKKTLESPEITIKHSYQSLLENKLVHIDESLKVALEKVGIEFGPGEASAAAPAAVAGEMGGPQDAVHKFLSFLSTSQNRLQTVAGDVKSFRDKAAATGQTSPADLLSVQLKISYVQQELELFANLLNKALESTKTVMNVQV